MYLRRGSFRLPCGRNGTMHMASPDAACPGLHRKPRDALPLADCSLCIALAADGAAINKTTTEKCTHFVVHFDGHRNAAVQYCGHCPMKEVQGLARSHWTSPSGESLLRY